MEIWHDLILLESIKKLQWGHNFFVMEIIKRKSGKGIDIDGFNGAITFSLWKSQKRKMDYPNLGNSFNGAITFSLWKLIKSDHFNIHVLASMGP